MITPVPRRRPWKLAKEVTTLDLLSGGRVILGVGLGSPAQGEYGLFGEPTGARERAELLDEGLDVLAGLWTGEPVLLREQALQGRPGPVLPGARAAAPDTHLGGRAAAGTGPLASAARWDGFIPIHSERADGVATPADIAAARDRIAALRRSTEGFDIAVWGTLDDGTLAARLPGYAVAGATWWVESVKTQSPAGRRPSWRGSRPPGLADPASGEPKVQSPRG